MFASINVPSVPVNMGRLCILLKHDLLFGALNSLIKNGNTDLKDLQKCINKNKRRCFVKFGFGQKAAPTDLEGRTYEYRIILGLREIQTLDQWAVRQVS